MERPAGSRNPGRAGPIARAIPDCGTAKTRSLHPGYTSALDQRCNGLVEIFNRHRTRVPFAIDVESRRRLDLELLHAPIPHLLDLGEQRLVVDARIETLFGETGLPGDGAQRRQRDRKSTRLNSSHGYI